MPWDPLEHVYSNKQRLMHVGLSNRMQLSIKCTMDYLPHKALTVLHAWSTALFRSSNHYAIDKHNRNSSYSIDIADTSATPWDSPELACQSKQCINQVQQPMMCIVYCLPQETSTVLHGRNSSMHNQPTPLHSKRSRLVRKL